MRDRHVTLKGPESVARKRLPLLIVVQRSTDDKDPFRPRMQLQSQAHGLGISDAIDEPGGAGLRGQSRRHGTLIGEYDRDPRKQFAAVLEKEFERRADSSDDNIDLSAGILLLQIAAQELRLV